MTTTVSGALREALKRALREDRSVLVMGEDVADYGGIYNVTRGLVREFGPERVIDTPMAEITIVGAGVGAAITGMRPVVEIMYADFLPIAMDQIVNNAAKFFALSGGRTPVPMVIRANFGSGKAEGAMQSQTPEAWFMNVPGIKVVMPSSPQDAYDLLRSSIADDNPVLFLEHKMLYQLQGELDLNAPDVSLSSAVVRRPGTQATIASCGLMAHRALRAADELAESEDIQVEVIDIRTLKPMDTATVCTSVRKTGAFMTVEENPGEGGWGLQLAHGVVEACFSELRCAPLRVASLDAPLPAASCLEDEVVPGTERIKRGIRALIARMGAVDARPATGGAPTTFHGRHA